MICLSKRFLFFLFFFFSSLLSFISLLSFSLLASNSTRGWWKSFLKKIINWWKLSLPNRPLFFSSSVSTWKSHSHHHHHRHDHEFLLPAWRLLILHLFSFFFSFFFLFDFLARKMRVTSERGRGVDFLFSFRRREKNLFFAQMTTSFPPSRNNNNNNNQVLKRIPRCVLMWLKLAALPHSLSLVRLSNRHK